MCPRSTALVIYCGAALVMIGAVESCQVFSFRFNNLDWLLIILIGIFFLSRQGGSPGDGACDFTSSICLSETLSSYNEIYVAHMIRNGYLTLAVSLRFFTRHTLRHLSTRNS